MIKPVAVLISDIHYNLNTLKLADAALNMAIDKANELEVPLVVAGDLHDTKANLRGECVNAMIEAFKRCKLKPTVLVGNHDKINEKSVDNSLGFLKPLDVELVTGLHVDGERCYLAYQHDPDECRRILKTIHKGSTVIMHQGVTGSKSGDYIQDKSAITVQDVAGLRVISGHYHTRQTIPLPDGGKWNYIGNPFTLTYGEADDPPKGFQILMGDGSLEFVPTNLREHVVLDYTVQELKGEAIFLGEDQDLLWVKIRGTKEELQKVTKQQVAVDLDINQPFKLDLIPIDTSSQANTSKNLTQGPLLDSLIDSLTNTSDERKTRLKDKWKTLA